MDCAFCLSVTSRRALARGNKGNAATCTIRRHGGQAQFQWRPRLIMCDRGTENDGDDGETHEQAAWVMLFRHEMAINTAEVAELGLPVPTGINAVELIASTVREDLHAQAPRVFVLEYLEHQGFYHMLQMDERRVVPAFETERDAAGFAQLAKNRDGLDLRVLKVNTKDLERYAVEWDADNVKPTLAFVPDGNTFEVSPLQTA